MKRAWTFEQGRFWVIELDRERDSQVGILPVVLATLSEVKRESAGHLARAMGLPDPEPVLRRLSTGKRCFAAWVHDQIAAYCWVSTGLECIGELEHEIHLPAGEAYVWDCATLPEHRRKRLYSALLSYIVSVHKNDGIRRVWIGSSLDNRPSMQAFARAGFQPVLTVFYTRLFNLGCTVFYRFPTAPVSLAAAARRMVTSRQERVWGPFQFISPVKVDCHPTG